MDAKNLKDTKESSPKPKDPIPTTQTYVNEVQTTNNNDDSRSNSSSLKLDKVVLLFRHGARGPSMNCLKHFKTSTIKSPFQEWDHNELEILSSVGIKQMENLGKWFREVYLKDFLPKEVTEKDVHWRSSKIDRVIESGKYFWMGFNVNLEHPHPFPNNEDPDDYFRVWHTNHEYVQAVKDLKTGPIYKQKALEEEKLLNETYQIFGIDISNRPLELRLSEMTYYHEVLDCERYFPIQKNALATNLSQEQIEEIEKLAQWNWDKRFFLPHFGKVIGGNLQEEVRKELFDQKTKFAAFSCHDYSLLSLLASLGKEKYEGEIFGFGAFIVFEAYRNQDGQVAQIKGYINSFPFDYRKDLTEVQWKPVELFPSEKLFEKFQEKH